MTTALASNHSLLSESRGGDGLRGFSVGPDQLTTLIDPKNPAHLETLGGFTGLCEGLNVQPHLGLCPGAYYETPSSRHRRKIKSEQSRGLWARLYRGWTDHQGNHQALPSMTQLPLSEIAVIPNQPSTGIDDLHDRETVFGVNRLPEVESATIFGKCPLGFNFNFISLFPC